LTLEEICTVSAVTDPLLAAGPNADTQSPTATSLEATDCRALTVVELVVVSLSVCVFGAVGCLLFELLEYLGAKLPGDTLIPDTVRVEPLTAVTLPEAMEKSPSRLRMLLGRDFGAPPGAPLPPGKFPLRTRKLPPAAPPGPPLTRVAPPVQEPVELAVVTLTERTAIVVFELFDGVPVAVTQEPTVTELTASLTVLENCVVEVQFTVVWPEFGFWTSMLEPAIAATLPKAPIGALAGVAAPAAEPTTVAVTIAVAPVPRHRAQRRRAVLPLVGVCIWIFLISV
jgi:hypothetical protein